MCYLCIVISNVVDSLNFKKMSKFTVTFIGIKKTCYAFNLGQAFQEARIFAEKTNLSLDFTVEVDEENIENPPYFGIYIK